MNKHYIYPSYKYLSLKPSVIHFPHHFPHHFLKEVISILTIVKAVSTSVISSYSVTTEDSFLSVSKENCNHLI